MPTPGILYVNSVIIRPESLSPETFTSWYENEHIPDIFATSGIKSAFRYKSLDPQAVRPYLALYPLNDLDWLQSAEFKSIPVHSDKYLRGGCVFDFADFDTRYYELVKTVGGDEGGKHGPATYILPIPLVDIASFEAPTLPSLRRTRIYKLTFARQNRLPQEEKKLAEPQPYLALCEFDGKRLQENGARDGETLAFGLIGAFGGVEAIS